jgi:hypothetical protein
MNEKSEPIITAVTRRERRKKQREIKKYLKKKQLKKN